MPHLMRCPHAWNLLAMACLLSGCATARQRELAAELAGPPVGDREPVFDGRAPRSMLPNPDPQIANVEPPIEPPAETSRVAGWLPIMRNMEWKRSESRDGRTVGEPLVPLQEDSPAEARPAASRTASRSSSRPRATPIPTSTAARLPEPAPLDASLLAETSEQPLRTTRRSSPAARSTVGSPTAHSLADSRAGGALELDEESVEHPTPPPVVSTRDAEVVEQPHVDSEAPSAVAVSDEVAWSEDREIEGPPELIVPQTCQCEAAAHSPMAAAIRTERQAVAQESATCGSRKLESAIALHSAIMCCRELDERNQSAATAMALYYQLAEIVALRPVMEETRREVDRLGAALQKLRATGVPTGADPTEILRRRLQTNSQQADVDFGAERLSRQMGLLMGRGSVPNLVPQCLLGVNRHEVDMQTAIDEGLACRPDLAALRLVRNCLNEDNLGVLRHAIGGLDPSMGMLIEKDCECFGCLKCILPDCGKSDYCELQRRRRQLDQLYEAQADRARAEIGDAVLALSLRLRKLEAAESTIATWEDRVEQLEKKDGSTVFLELAEARFAVLKAKADALHEAAWLEKERAQLFAVQGVLARQCGFSGCCDRQCQHTPAE